MWVTAYSKLIPQLLSSWQWSTICVTGTHRCFALDISTNVTFTRIGCATCGCTDHHHSIFVAVGESALYRCCSWGSASGRSAIGVH